MRIRGRGPIVLTAALAVAGCVALGPAAEGASSALPADLTGHVISRIPTSAHVVALTFDGGSGAEGAHSILQTLDDRGVPATFFLTGDFVQAHQHLAVRISRTYVVGNHTMTHPHMNDLTNHEIRAEVRHAAETLKQVTGVNPKPWFRFPFGEYNSRTLRVVNDLGYAAIGWTIDTLGWEGTAVTSAAGIVTRVRDNLVPGAIVLMHLGANPDDGSTLDADALPKLIHTIRDAGYRFTTVRRLLK